MKHALLDRFNKGEEQTRGSFSLYDDNDILFSCSTIEPPWKDNANNISCIPAGVYSVVPYTSTKYPNTYHVLNVPGRHKILIHWGNFVTNTEGCILVGEGFIDINNDGLKDVVKSKDTLIALKEAINYEGFELEIV